MSSVVSVVVPAYNMEAYLKAALSSIAAQSMRDFECIVVDDGSTDRTRTIIEEFRRTDPRFRLLAHHANAGLSAARNSGLRAARGHYIAFLDADDLMTPHSLAMRLEACRHYVASDARWAGVYCGTRTIKESAKDLPPEEPIALRDVGFPNSGGMCPFNANQPMLRRDVLLQLGGFDETLKQAEDYDLWMRIMRAGYWFVAVPRVGVAYRRRSGSMIREAPLAHLALSMSYFEAANKEQTPRAADQARRGLFGVPIAYPKPVDAYALQMRKAPRVLEFVGMALPSADDTELDRLAAIVVGHLPDLPLIVRPGPDALDALLEKGVTRQSGDMTPEKREQIEKLKAVIGGLTAQELGPEPTLHPQTEADRHAGAIYFFPHTGYHAWTIDLIAPALRAAKTPFVVVDISVPRGDDRGLREKLSRTGLPSISYSRFILDRHRPGLIVVFNDWDHVTRPIIAAARAAGVPTASIVEGIQDYADVDTGRKRDAYRAANLVLLPSTFDRRYFTEGGRQRFEDVGIPRVKHLRTQRPPVPTGDMQAVLINSNFSYDVQTEHRDAWVRSAVAAVRAAGLEPVITRHPGDVGREHDELVTNDDFYTALAKSTVTVQRFASGILEALALGRGVVYFNPHGEKVDKFQDPLAAYRIANTVADLTLALSEWPKLVAMAAESGPAFLDLHAGATTESTEDSIVKALSAERVAIPSDAVIDDFHEFLARIDRATEALTNGKPLFLEIDDEGLKKEFARLGKTVSVPGESAPSATIVTTPRRSALSTFRPVWFLRTSLDSALGRLYRREKKRNSPLFKWVQPLVRLYRKLIAPY